MQNTEYEAKPSKLPNDDLKDIDLSNLILIKNPDEEILLGYNTEAKNTSIILNTTGSEKMMTHLHYGTFLQQQRDIENQPIPVDPQLIYAIRFEIVILKYLIILLSFVLIILDCKTIKSRLHHKKEIIAELRSIHIQMDDVELYQIFWSFILVYMASLICYSALLVLSICNGSLKVIRYTFRIAMFTLIYQFLEIILRRYDVLIILLRFFVIILLRRWIILKRFLLQNDNPESATANANSQFVEWVN